MKLIPKLIAFPQQMLDRLKLEQEVTGLSASEIIRRAVDEYLTKTMMFFDK
jgi:hypothetical protein